ncbi:hypothetical protein [Streptomyces sp. G-G2]|uniref:hypothetical protein n=1 Tax=Streptomyces sp. G-G2 TaxID=3046201 RepID=UPI0024B99634|nr:hypothetical protein [Streptomyces sp. G-G2]MDJ0384799.1 hypothetical protein [Streptomyces sp. G-G2]
MGADRGGGHGHPDHLSARVAQGAVHVAQNTVLVLAAVALVCLFTAVGRRHLLP